MTFHRKLLTVALAVALSGPALAQFPAGLRDLVGARAGQGELEIRRRGYTAVRTNEGRDAKFTYWRRGDECIQVTTRDGRYLTMVNASKASCGFSGSPSTSAVVTGVAIVGLAAALAAHKRTHQNGDRSHDDEFQRGYSAGFDGAAYDGRHETEGYHEGYLAGESERDNRRYADTGLMRNVPQAARSACSRRADAFQNRSGSVPISMRELGRGDYELTMATGPYRSRCTVSTGGAVRAMEPY
jgi:hypothetical protein